MITTLPRILSLLLLLGYMVIGSTVLFAQQKKPKQPAPSVQKAPVKAKLKTTDSSKAKLSVLERTPLTQVEKDSMAAMKYAAVTQPCSYMTTLERDIILYLNVARMYPKWFLYFFLKKPTTENEKSLYQTMSTMKAATKILIPNKALFESAKCHAISSGRVGYLGHERQDNLCKESYKGECCHYGYNEASAIVLDLLIDEDVPSLGHRKICLDSVFTKIGVSVQPHKTYRDNSVLDFGY